MIRPADLPPQPPALGSFTYVSDLAKDQSTKALDNTQKQIAVVHNILNAGYDVYKNSKGAPIVNASRERIWFARSVAFVFALGRIYDDDDDAKMQAIMNYFNDEGDHAYLENHYRVESYSTSPLVQEIEKRLRLGNGNYHVVMVPIVYAEDNMLDQAPESQFKRKGILDKYTSWESITDYMKDMIVRYGLVVKMDRPRTQTSHEIGSTDLPEDVPRSRYDEATKFNYNDLNGNIEHMQTIAQTLKIKEDLTNDFNQRQRRAKIDREGDYSGAVNAQKRTSLYTQMYGKDIGTMNYDVKSDGMKGVAAIIDDRVMPPVKKVDEFQLYDDAFDDKNNKNVMFDVTSERGQMPQLPQFATRATSNGNRTVNTNIGPLTIRSQARAVDGVSKYNT